ncbi:MAG: EAL domain-containing protein, partial [Deltaproteobacteria bacterium]|nr:EAL domain-containing protein [Deltaproteobacteria bacterium]
NQIYRTGQPAKIIDYEVVRKDKTRRILELSASLRRDRTGLPIGFRGVVRDVTKRRRTEEALSQQRAYFQQLFEGSPQAIVILNVDGKIINANKGYEHLFGYRPAEIKGRNNLDLLIPEDLMAEGQMIHQTALSGKSIQRETHRRHKDGRLIPTSVLGYPIKIGSEIVGAFYIYMNISERKSIEKALAHQAFHDALTGLPNRVLFSERLGRALERIKRNQDHRFAVLLFDLDRFKQVNDSYGHITGDKLLVAVSSRLSKCFRAVDTVARLGGDEFAVLMEEVNRPEQIISVVNRAKEYISEPFLINNQEIFTSASIGIVIKTDPFQTPEEIMRDADIAMYRAKELGKGYFKFFSRKMYQQTVALVRLETELRQAIDHKQFELHYQPILAVPTQQLVGMEALIRWNHPQRGMLFPNIFIPLAEDTGLIVPIGSWAIAEACQQLKEWQNEFKVADNLVMNVNISSKQLLLPDFVDYVTHVLKETHLDPRCLKLEITETVIMQDTKTTIERLTRLVNLGVRIVVDDFGTGYSSLSYLQRFPIDVLKIDRSFISGSGNVQDNIEIVKTIISLARSLGLSVVAEGVENEDQLDALKSLKCELAQGYLFSKPLDKLTIHALMKNLKQPG